MFREIADRVYVARYPQWDVNVGLVLGSDGADVIDTRASDRQGREVVDEIRTFGREIAVSHVLCRTRPHRRRHRDPRAGRRSDVPRRPRRGVRHPSFGDDCWPLEWPDALTSHLGRIGPATVVVPGHGRPVDAAFVTRQRDEITEVATVIDERRRSGLTLEQALSEPDARLPFPLESPGSAIRRGWSQ